MVWIYLGVTNAWAQSPVASFTAEAAACRSQQLTIQNTSTQASRYEWDFCLDDFVTLKSSTSVATLTGGFGEGYGYKLVEDNGNWYAFVTSRSNQHLYRLSYGTNPLSNPTVVDLGNVDGKLLLPEGIDLVKIGANWYGFVGSLEFSTAAQGVIRLDFGTSLENVPTAQNLGNFGTVTRYRDLKVVKQGADLILILVSYNGGTVVRVNYRDSFDNAITAANITDSGIIPGVSLPVGIDVVKKGTSWIMLMASLNNSRILQLDFGSDITSTPTVVADLGFTGVTRPYKVKITEEAGKYYAAVANESVAAKVIDFKDLNPANAPSALSHTGLPVLLGIETLRWKGTSVLMGASTVDTQIRTLVFESSCDASTSFSAATQPAGVSYAQAGDKRIELRAFSATESSSAFTTVTISSLVSPDVSISTDGSVCDAAPIPFTINNTSGGIAGITWDFGDTGTSSGTSTSHQFAAGDYTVRATATATNTCTNVANTQVSVFQQPQANFSLPGVNPFCTNQQYTFVNTSVIDPDHAVTWEWLVNGVSKAATQDLTYTFTQTSSQDVVLKASIPGCENSATKNIASLSSGPIVDFTFNGRCEDSDVIFTNNSSGVINGFVWDFDDGQSVSGTDATHTFTDIGTYQVSLTASTAAGCNNSVIKSVPIYSKPVVDFAVQAPPFSCSGTSSMFTNSTVNPSDSNIAGWLWDFGDPASASNSSTLKTPQHTYNTAGDYPVSLTATTNFGCQTVKNKSITIAASPDVSFSHDPTCQDANVQFKDLTGGQSWDWQIGTSFYTTQNVSHQFTTPGMYPVFLTVTGLNGCIGSTSSNVTVPPKLTPNFSVSKNCVGQGTVFTDLTNDAADPIAQRKWTINGGLVVENDNATTYNFDVAGVYETTLVIVTSTGCVSTPVVKNVSIGAPPVATFTATPETGGAPLQVQFANTSTGAVSYSWKFNDPNNTTSALVNPQFTFLEIGEYAVELTATSLQACVASISKVIRVVQPRINVGVGKVELLETASGFVPEITIVNQSNVNVSNVTLLIDLGGKTQLTQTTSGTVAPGASLVYRTPFALADPAVRYICAESTLDNDADPTNDRACEELGTTTDLIAPHPNPASSTLRVEWIGKAGNYSLQLINSVGSAALNLSVEGVEGFNARILEVDYLPAGIYLLSLQRGSFQKTFRVVINH